MTANIHPRVEFMSTTMLKSNPRNARSPDGDSRTGDALPLALAAVAAADHRLAAMIDTGSPAGSRPPGCTPDARSARDVGGHERQLHA